MFLGGVDHQILYRASCSTAKETNDNQLGQGPMSKEDVVISPNQTPLASHGLPWQHVVERCHGGNKLCRLLDVCVHILT